MPSNITSEVRDQSTRFSAHSARLVLKMAKRSAQCQDARLAHSLLVALSCFAVCNQRTMITKTTSPANRKGQIGDREFGKLLSMSSW
jgi:hypothetical protein